MAKSNFLKAEIYSYFSLLMQKKQRGQADSDCLSGEHLARVGYSINLVFLVYCFHDIRCCRIEGLVDQRTKVLTQSSRLLVELDVD